MTVRSAASINASPRDDKKKESDNGIKADVFKMPSKPKVQQGGTGASLYDIRGSEELSIGTSCSAASTCGSSRWRMMENIREFELEKPTNQIEGPCS